ncbi:MAG: hypothetical protein AAGH99_08480 [Planctomycetota bacterium]
MNFSTDRDLLALEPMLFNDVPWVGQQRVALDDAYVTGTTLTSASANFVATQVESGGVVVIDRVAHEVISRDDAGTLTVSLLRTRLSDAPIPGDPGGPFNAAVRTFAPQAKIVHDGLLRLLGIDADTNADDPEALSEDAVVSISVIARLEALGTLERVYSGAAALVGDNQMLIYKAGEYRRRFRHATAQASVLLDTNGDGHADERRRLGMIRLQRV